MLVFHKDLLDALKASTSLPIYYEQFVDSSVSKPCVTYMQASNNSYKEGNTLRYSNVSYYVKVWGSKLDVMLPEVEKIDIKMKELGFKRQSYNELATDTELCLISLYTGIGYEKEK